MSRNFYVKLQKAKSEGKLDEAIQYYSNASSEYETNKYINFCEKVLETNIIPTVLIGNLSLQSIQRNKNIYIGINEINELAEEIVENHLYLFPFQLRASSILLIMAYENLPNKDKNNELFNFLYHCRNAAAHNGKITITKQGEKRLPAKRGNIEISQQINGKNLFQENEDGLLKLGDPLYLLYDIENTYL